MPLTCTGKAVFEDPETEKTVTIDADNLDWELVCADERQIGVECGYEASIQIELEENVHEIKWTVYEYPVGCFNYKEVECGELTMVQDFSYSFSEPTEDD